eukprot:Blabericola_migrator_1__694@NODE_1171_length_5221_cov_17_174040_g637_i1_p1_GENE_NODE_1171_length_5221_cov_17_174040_g637_i1NODE_1171_length_5221_cov_17_174040_g637_i1_p1_ORF_typecomplete_len1335_score224_14Annexin/PF00191_20/8_1e02Annexin/PF00191_20/7_6e03Annexin/PF00191_20/0_37_NODE_1171_length_5221_cov_17_174040_g637_i112175002
MRGVVPQELTLRLPFLQAAALVLVSGRNGLFTNGASDEESTPEWPTANNHEENFIPFMDLLGPEISLGDGIKEASVLRDTLASWVDSDVISTITAQDAAPSGSKRTHSTVEEEPQMKKPRFDTPHDLPCSSTAALSCEDQSIEAFVTSEGPATTSINWHCNAFEPDQHPVQAEMIDTAQEHDDWATLSAWLAELPVGEATYITTCIDSIGSDASVEGILGRQVASSAEPTHAIYESTATDATAPAPELIFAYVPTAYTDAEQPLGGQVNVNTPSDGNVQDVQLPALGAASIDSIECDAGTEGILGQQVASSAEPTHASYESTPTDATAPALERIFVYMPTAYTDAEQPLGGQVNVNTPSGGNVQDMDTPLGEFVEKMPSSQDHSGSSGLAGAQTFLGSSDLKPLLVATLESPNSLPSEQTLRSSFRIMSRASTSDDVGPKMLISDRLQENTSLAERSQTTQKEVRSAAYKAAQEVLRSPERAKMIRRWSVQGLRVYANTNMANAPYLSSSWLMERLVLSDKVPLYSNELQTAFECFGYDNVLIPDLFRRALDLAHTLKLLRRIPDPKHGCFRDAFTYCIWATDIVQDALFRGRSIRPDLKTYLRDKLKIQNFSKLQLPNLAGSSSRQKSNMRTLETDLRMIKRVINPKAVTSHPLDFTTFFNDVVHLITTCHSQRKIVGGGGAVRNTKEPDITKSQDDMMVKSNAKNKKQKRSRTRNPDADLNRVIAIVTKYKTLFKIDLAAKVEALLKAPPNEDGLNLLNSAVEEGYVPLDLLHSKLIDIRRLYSSRTYCSLGSITALYRQLFEETDETSSPEVQGEQEGSDLDASDATDESLGLDAMQNYLLQPYVDAKPVGTLIANDFDLLSVASETLTSWKQNLEPFRIAFPDDIPEDLIPLIHSHAPFGTPQWVLTELMHLRGPEGHQEYRNELYFVSDLLGYPLVDIKQVFAKAMVLAAAIIVKHEVSIRDAIDHLKLSKTSQVYVLAADIIHATFFRTWPQRRDLARYFAKQLRYEVLPQHEECLREVMAKREEWHSQKAVRTQKGDKEVIRDWSSILAAKKSSMEEMEDDHPLSFDCFFTDVEVITDSNNSAIPAIASKYKLLFDRDIVEDLKTIRAHSPQICYNKSFVKGIEEGYVPYRYAVMLTVPRSETMMLNKNSLPLLGAHVDYFMSLVGPADAEVSREMCTLEDTTLAQKSDLTASLSSANEVDQKPQVPRPEPEEQRAQLMAILRQAPPQKPPTGGIASTEASELHPVAQYLLGRS